MISTLGFARLDLTLRRRATLGYAAGLAIYTLVVVMVYPAFKDSTSLDKLTQQNSAIAALLGVSGSLTSPGGWLNANLYSNFFPLVMLLLTIGYGAAALAGQDEEGTLGLLLAVPVRRRTVVLEKAGAMALQGLALAAVVAACVVVGRSFDLAAPAVNVVAVSFATLVLGVDFGLVTMAVGAALGRRGTAIGVAAALAAASYLVSSLAPVVSWIRPARYASLFYWAVGNDQIDHGVTAEDYAVLLGLAAVAAAATVVAFRRLDLH